jgi:metallo-beta-lactamase class B
MRSTLAILALTGVTAFAQGQAPAPAPANETLSQTFRGSRGRDIEYQKIPPFKALDNVFHVGPGSVSVWLIPTTAGLILVDTAQEPYVDHILNNIRNLGYDPKDIRYILLTQGHLDHFGGAARIRDLSGARVAAAEGDWVMMDEYAKRPAPAIPPFHRTVERDMVLKDGDVITLGNTSMKVYLLPGHTPGGASFEFTAFDRGRSYKAFLFGGPEPRDGVEGAKNFMASVNRLAAIPDVSVGLLVHSWLAMSTYPNGGTFERMVQLQLRRGDMPNPFVDPASWRGWMDRLKMVSQKFLADEQAKAKAGSQ